MKKLSALTISLISLYTHALGDPYFIPPNPPAETFNRIPTKQRSETPKARRRKIMNENLLQVLREEHRNVKTLLSRIELASDVLQRKELYLQLKSELLDHLIREEKTLYTHLAEDVDDQVVQELIDNSNQEHRQLKALIAQIDNLGIENPEWKMLFQRLKEHFGQHVETEEKVLFNQAREDFSRQELEEFADEFEEIKQHLDN